VGVLLLHLTMPIFFRCTTSPLPRPFRPPPGVIFSRHSSSYSAFGSPRSASSCRFRPRTLSAKSAKIHFMQTCTIRISSYHRSESYDHHTLSSSFRCHLYVVSSTVATVYLGFFTYCKCCLINIQTLVVFGEGKWCL